MDNSTVKAKKPINLKKGGLVWSIWNFTEAALLIVLGILAIVFSGKTNLQSAILPVVGGFLIAGGALRILTNYLPIFSAHGLEAAAKAQIKNAMAYDLVIAGALELALGITFVIAYTQGQTDVWEAFVRFAIIFIATILIIAGANFFLFAIAFIVTKLYRLYMPILEMIFGGALIALGAVILVYLSGDSDLVNQIVLIVVGIILTLIGVGVLATTARAIVLVKEEKRNRKEAEETVDASSVDAIDVTSVPTQKDDDDKK